MRINKPIVVFIVTLVLTPLWIMLSYIKWQYLDIDLSLALSDFQKWPWIKATIIMAIVTYLYSYYAYFQLKENKQEIEGSAAGYAIMYMSGFFFIFYPGADAFGGSDSSSKIGMVGIGVTHYYAVKMFTKDLVLKVENNS